MKILITLFFIFFIFSHSFSHECILKGSTPFDIQSYNTCKNDLKIETSTESKDVLISDLKKENKLLKNKLIFLKNKLREIITNIE